MIIVNILCLIKSHSMFEKYQIFDSISYQIIDVLLLEIVVFSRCNYIIHLDRVNKIDFSCFMIEMKDLDDVL